MYVHQRALFRFFVVQNKFLLEDSSRIKNLRALNSQFLDLTILDYLRDISDNSVWPVDVGSVDWIHFKFFWLMIRFAYFCEL